MSNHSLWCSWNIFTVLVWKIFKIFMRRSTKVWNNCKNLKEVLLISKRKNLLALLWRLWIKCLLNFRRRPKLQTTLTNKSRKNLSVSISKVSFNFFRRSVLLPMKNFGRRKEFCKRKRESIRNCCDRRSLYRAISDRKRRKI